MIIISNKEIGISSYYLTTGTLPAIFAKTSMAWTSIFYVLSNRDIRKRAFHSFVCFVSKGPSSTSEQTFEETKNMSKTAARCSSNRAKKLKACKHQNKKLHNNNQMNNKFESLNSQISPFRSDTINKSSSATNKHVAPKVDQV